MDITSHPISSSLSHSSENQILKPSAQSPAFPIPWEEEQSVTRRNFMSFVLLLSTTLFASTGLLGVITWLRRKSATAFTPVLIASVHDVPVGSAKLFSYPTVHDPCLLIRLSEDRFIAYSQKCTHLSCPVTFKAQENEFFCPCHAGRFAVEDGHVLGGPPQRPLPRILIKVSGEQILATGVHV
jgi:nitrite reductase/ring-hydroxylating ferredoxin subunit